MDNHSLDVLGFNAIKERLSSFACSELGKRLCYKIAPKLDKTGIEQDLLQVQQAKEALSIFGCLPLSGLKDINPILTKAGGNGACLDIQELLAIGGFLDVTQGIAHWFSHIHDGYPSIKSFDERLIHLDDLKMKIEGCINPAGEVKDSASPLLEKIRKNLRLEKERIIQTLEGLLKESEGKEAFQTDFVTIRNDRYVVPVKANKKGMLQGIVHDESGSGATLFIEPMVSVEAQNKYSRLKIKEKEEVKRILLKLSTLVSDLSGSLKENLEVLAELDFIQAKALFSQAIEGIAPIISPDPIIRLRGARHALLIFRHKDSPDMGSEPVAIDIELNRKTRALVISGPNTGGKTVTLKMVGLLQIMMQSGLLLPVKEGSELGIFNKVLADIGDEQDIEKDLSSFSSHIKNISRILDHIDPKSIVLLDELGSDTNPTEGAALGIAVLEYILKKGALCLVTTHHNGIKAYASSHHNEIKNASMGFDPDRKLPTYILHIGYPGSSNALGICTNLGLPDEILKRARTVMGEGEVQLENLLLRIEHDEGHIKEELEKQIKIRQETELIKERYNRLLSVIEEREAKVMKEAQSGIQILIEKARKDIERLVAELKRSTLTSRAIKTAHKGLREVANRFNPAPSSKNIRYKGIEIEKISIGQPVFICDLNEKGVVSRIDLTENKVWVMVGPLKLQVRADKLAPAESPTHLYNKEMYTGSGTIHIASSVSTKEISTQLIVIGQRVEDALQKIDKYLDNAVLAHLSFVSIIHGKGTGTLKKAIEKFLSAHPQVASFRSGTLQEGGTGVTVVELAA